MARDRTWIINLVTSTRSHHFMNHTSHHTVDRRKHAPPEMVLKLCIDNGINYQHQLVSLPDFFHQQYGCFRVWGLFFLTFDPGCQVWKEGGGGLRIFLSNGRYATRSRIIKFLEFQCAKRQAEVSALIASAMETFWTRWFHLDSFSQDERITTTIECLVWIQNDFGKDTQHQYWYQYCRLISCDWMMSYILNLSWLSFKVTGRRRLAVSCVYIGRCNFWVPSIVAVHIFSLASSNWFWISRWLQSQWAKHIKHQRTSLAIHFEQS